jgi:hypothetical protein
VINTQSSTTQVASDWNNIALDRGRASNDRSHSFVLSGIWRLDYLKGAPRLIRTVTGGWSVTAIGSMRSGLPLTGTSGSDRNFDGSTNDRADLIGDPYLDPNRPRNEVVDRWFNTAAFKLNVNGFNGTAGRGIFSGPGLKNVDLGIYREFRLTERGLRLMFRSEMSNAFNLVNLSNPGTSLGSTSTLGRITTGGPMRQVQLGLRLTF